MTVAELLALGPKLGFLPHEWGMLCELFAEHWECKLAGDGDAAEAALVRFQDASLAIAERTSQ